MEWGWGRGRTDSDSTKLRALSVFSCTLVFGGPEIWDREFGVGRV